MRGITQKGTQELHGSNDAGWIWIFCVLLLGTRAFTLKRTSRRMESCAATLLLLCVFVDMCRSNIRICIALFY